MKTKTIASQIFLFLSIFLSDPKSDLSVVFIITSSAIQIKPAFRFNSAFLCAITNVAVFKRVFRLVTNLFIPTP